MQKKVWIKGDSDSFGFVSVGVSSLLLFLGLQILGGGRRSGAAGVRLLRDSVHDVQRKDRK
jgi:hypothetical protein